MPLRKTTAKTNFFHLSDWLVFWWMGTVPRGGCGLGGAGDAAHGARSRAPHPGRAVQVDPIKPKLKPLGNKRLKPKYDTPLSKLPFAFNLRRYTLVPAEFCEVSNGSKRDPAEWFARVEAGAYTRPLLSST